MAITDRQAAAFRRRKQDKEADRRMAEERARLTLVVPADDGLPADPNLHHVGWQWPGDSLKGSRHVCARCSPEQPGLGFRRVLRMQLAARAACTRCGTVLEAVVLEAVTAAEKKD